MPKTELGERPHYERGERVVVTEQGLQPWEADVVALKPSSVSGWWLEVRRDDGGTWALVLSTPGMTVEKLS